MPLKTNYLEKSSHKQRWFNDHWWSVSDFTPPIFPSDIFCLVQHNTGKGGKGREEGLPIVGGSYFLGVGYKKRNWRKKFGEKTCILSLFRQHPQPKDNTWRCYSLPKWKSYFSNSKSPRKYLAIPVYNTTLLGMEKNHHGQTTAWFGWIPKDILYQQLPTSAWHIFLHLDILSKSSSSHGSNWGFFCHQLGHSKLSESKLEMWRKKFGSTPPPTHTGFESPPGFLYTLT